MERENQTLQQQEFDEFLCLSSQESEEIDLSYWEFINPSDADDDEIDDLSLDSINDDGLFVSWHSSMANSIVAQEESHLDGEVIDLVVADVGVGVGAVIGGGFVEEQQVSYVGDHHQYDDDDVAVGLAVIESLCYGDDDVHHDHGYDGSDGCDDDYDGYGGYDVDDELVPRAWTTKLERQRMRKLGKRASAKVNSSKRSPFSYVKPGAVHGKHGLGMKCSC